MNEHGVPRRVRIEGHPNRAHGYAITVSDADTGELIPAIACAVIYLNPAKVNEVELTCYVTNDRGRVITDGKGYLIREKMHVEDPEVDVTAYER